MLAAYIASVQPNSTLKAGPNGSAPRTTPESTLLIAQPIFQAIMFTAEYMGRSSSGSSVMA
jgi:hypothetical protein